MVPNLVLNFKQVKILLHCLIIFQFINLPILRVYLYIAFIPFLYYHLALKLWLLENWFYSKGHKSRSHWMSQLKSKNVFLFQFKNCVTILQHLSKSQKACCLSCKIPIFTELYLGVVTPILGNPFCPSDTKPSLELFFFNVYHKKWKDLVWKFTFFYQISKDFSVTGGCWETLILASALWFWKLLPFAH